jgi:hypothetical protein
LPFKRNPASWLFSFKPHHSKSGQEVERTHVRSRLGLYSFLEKGRFANDLQQPRFLTAATGMEQTWGAVYTRALCRVKKWHFRLRHLWVEGGIPLPPRMVDRGFDGAKPSISGNTLFIKDL